MTPMPTIYLIPAPLDATSDSIQSPLITHLRHFVVENAKTARAILKKVLPDVTIQECLMVEVNEHSEDRVWQEWLSQYKDKDIGILSEAGMPCVADPGSKVVLWGHGQGYRIVPLIGPCAIIMALAASGLNGQQFAFHGYLPRKSQERINSIKLLEEDSKKWQRTQICIEAPHHNDSLLEDLINTLQPTTRLSIASALTTPQEHISTKTVRQWREQSRVPLTKVPTVFSIAAKT